MDAAAACCGFCCNAHLVRAFIAGCRCHPGDDVDASPLTSHAFRVSIQAIVKPRDLFKCMSAR